MTPPTTRAAALFASALTITSLSLAPSPARATCIDPASCICQSPTPDAVLTVQVTAVGDTTLDSTVESVTTAAGKTVPYAAGDAVALPAGEVTPTPTPGDALLIAVAGADLHPIVQVDDDSHVTCSRAPSYRPEVRHAVSLILSSDCHIQADEEMGPIPCDDTVDTNESACSLSPSAHFTSSSGLWASLGAFGLALLTARRRRR